MSAEAQLPIALPASSFVRELANSLDADVPRRILDVGCGSGRNAWHLARLGHQVLGISNRFDEISEAVESGQEGLDCHFVVADARHLPLSRPFDIVIGNEFLHLMSKQGSNQVLDAMRRRTVQGGINAVSGYLVEPTAAVGRNALRMLRPDELAENYADAGWHIISYDEDIRPYSYGPDRRQHVSSLAKIVAQRPW